MDFGSILAPSGPLFEGLLASFPVFLCYLIFVRILLDFGSQPGGPGGGCHDVGSVTPGLRLVTFGVKAEGFAREGLHFQDFRGTCSGERTDFPSVLYRICQIL